MTKLKIGSLFAGIGGFDLGFTRAGFEVAWSVEINPNSQQVLRKQFPNAEIYGDITQVQVEDLEKVDIICGGFPCQDLSFAGKRKGLAGERSGLFYEAMRLIRGLNPRIVILENVPGLLSSNSGRDFAALLSEMDTGWDCQEIAWRVLDSRFFGVPQRRKRVFIVASSGIGCAEQVLALSESVSGNFKPRKEKGKGAAYISRADSEESNSTVTAIRTAFTGANGIGVSEGVSHTLDLANGQAITDNGIIRRFTPVEVERLQGFPDGWTDGQTDANRYKQLGNAVTVNVIEWLANNTKKYMEANK
jgi:DNA (cytosine-5)-methyltransferase 1